MVRKESRDSWGSHSERVLQKSVQKHIQLNNPPVQSAFTFLIDMGQDQKNIRFWLGVQHAFDFFETLRVFATNSERAVSRDRILRELMRAQCFGWKRFWNNNSEVEPRAQGDFALELCISSVEH
eukprot:Gb_25482 [translate_table: standard]